MGAANLTSKIPNVSGMDETLYEPGSQLNNGSSLILPQQNITQSSRRDEQLAKVEVAVQAVIFCLALFGNTCVLVALRYRRKKTSRMHLFIMHLSIADLLVAFLNILPQMAWDITYRFQGNDFLCRVVKYFQVMVMYLSTYVLVMTAIDRYRAICHPLSNYSWSSKRVHLMVGLAYAIALVFSVPQVIIFRLGQTETGDIDCWGHFNPPWTVTLYITCFAITIFILPFLLLTGLYGKICFEVWKNVRRKRTGSYDVNYHNGKVVYKFNGTGTISVIAPNSAGSRESSQRRNNINPRTHSSRGFSRSKMKTIKLTFVVIIAYMVCWSPFFVAQMWWAYDDNAPYNNSTFVVCLLLGSLNSCCNPWIYMAFSGGLMQHLLPWIQRLKRPKRKERARSIVEVASNSSSSDNEGHDALLLEQFGNKFTHCCYDNNVSHTSTTKVTAGPFSPNSSLKSRHKTCCMHRACHLGNGHYMNGKVGNNWDKRTAHRGKIPVCRCLHKIREDGFGEKYENVFYDLSIARKTRRTSSQPSLVPPVQSGLSVDKVDMRCTTSA